MRELLLPKLEETYEQLRRVARRSRPARRASDHVRGPILAEREGLPWVSTVLAPMLFFSAADLPVFPQSPSLVHARKLGVWAARLMVGLARSSTNAWVEPVHRLRAELGLPRGGHPMFEGMFSPHLTLALFSRVLGLPQPDWPRERRDDGLRVLQRPRRARPEARSVSRGRRAARRVHARHVGGRRRGALLSRERRGGGAARRPRGAAHGRVRAERARRAAVARRAARRSRAAPAAVPARERGRPSRRRRHDGTGAALRAPDDRRAARPRSARQRVPRDEARRVAHDLSAALQGRARRARARARARATTIASAPPATAAAVRREGGADAAAAAIEKLLG